MAASPQGIRAGRAFVEIGGNDAALVKALDRASARIKGWGRSISGLGGKMALGSGGLPGPLGSVLSMLASPAGLLGGFAAAVRITTELAAAISNMSARTGISVRRLQELDYAARMTGTSLQALEPSIRKMQQNIANAARGERSALDILRRYGLNIRELARMAPGDQFMRIAEAVAAIPNPTRRAAAAMELFGEAGAQMLPMLANGAAGLRRMRQDAHRLGLIMGQQDVAAAEELGDRINTVGLVARHAAAAIGAALIPDVRELANWTIGAILAVRRWIRDNRDLIAVIARTTAAVVAAGAAIALLGVAVTWIGGAIGVMSTVLGVLLNPITLVVIGIGALIGVFGNLRAIGLRAFNDLRAGLAGLWRDFQGLTGGVIDAVMGGDWAAAWGVVVTFGRLQWAKLSAYVRVLWEDVYEWLATKAIQWSTAIINAADSAWTQVQISASNAFTEIEVVWYGLVATVKTAWYTAVSSMASFMVDKMLAAVEAVGGPIINLLERLHVMSAAEAAAARAGMAGMRNNAMGAIRGWGAGGANQAAADRDAAIAAARAAGAGRAGGLANDAAGRAANRNAAAAGAVAAAAARAAAARAGAGGDIAGAQQDFQNALAAARAARARARRQFPVVRRDGQVAPLDVTGQRSVAGTFNAFGLGRMGSNAADRTARATEATARNTAQLLLRIGIQRAWEA